MGVACLCFWWCSWACTTKSLCNQFRSFFRLGSTSAWLSTSWPWFPRFPCTIDWKNMINSQIKDSKKLPKFVYLYLKSDKSHNNGLTYKDIDNNLYMNVGYIKRRTWTIVNVARLRFCGYSWACATKSFCNQFSSFLCLSSTSAYLCTSRPWSPRFPGTID